MSMTNASLIDEAGSKVALDVIVVSAKHAEEWGHFKGSMLNEALSEGRVLVEA